MIEPISAGLLRHSITLLEQSISSDISGAATTYAPDDPPITARAMIQYVSGKELLASGQDVSQVVLKVTIRYRPEFAPNKRIQGPNGNQYIIQAIDNVNGMNVYMILLCMGVGGNN